MILILAACSGSGLNSKPFTGGTDPLPADSADSGGGTNDSSDSADSAQPEDTGAKLPPACGQWGTPEQTGTVQDPLLNEISGVAPSTLNPGALWVVEDHANPNAVVAVDVYGATIATVTLDGVENNDWEDLTIAPCGTTSCIVVADSGNNDRDRTDTALVVFEEPALSGIPGTTTVTPNRYTFSWPNGIEDNESITQAADGRFILLAKRQDHTAGVYTLPPYTGEVVATFIADISTGAEEDNGGATAATSVSMWPDQSRLLVRTYVGTREYTLSAGIDSAGTATEADLPSPVLAGDEGVAYDAEKRGYWTIPEMGMSTTGSAIWFVPCEDGL